VARSAFFGLSLVETLLSLLLMGILVFSTSSILMKTQVTSSSLKMRFQEAAEAHSLVLDLRKDLRQGAYISDNSSDSRLEYTTYDTSGNATKKIYQLSVEGGRTHLKHSLDGGATWMSPYKLSAYTKYSLSGSPRFLYAGSDNNCTDFPDTDGNGVWLSGTDAAGSYTACPNGTATPLNRPSQAEKAILHNFQFTTGSGSPEASRTLPTDLFITVSGDPVRSDTAPTAPAVKDPSLLQSFTTNTANSLFGTAFDVRSPCWDPARGRLLLVGRQSSGSNKIYRANRRGVLIGAALATTLPSSPAGLDGAALESDGKTLLALDATGKKLYRFDLSATATLVPSTTLDLASPSNLINTPTSIAYDPSTPNDFYIVGTDPGTSALRIYERNKITGALVGSAWSLPAAFDASHPPGGMTIEPFSGDFLVVRNYVNGSAPNKTIDIYRIDRATGSSTSFAINISDLGSSAATTTGNWGIAYEAATNHLFLADSATAKVYEVVPPLLISPRS
jgi:type II secretory pathway component PulJ